MMNIRQLGTLFGTLFTLCFTPCLMPTAAAAPSPYDDLKALYDSATTPASLSDFDVWGAPTTVDCAGAIDKFPRMRIYSVWKQYPVVIKGLPSYGPLFPGTPDQTRTVLMPTIYEQSENQHLVDFFAKLLHVTTEGADLVLSQDKCDHQKCSPPAKLWFRKTQDLIVFKESIGFGTPSEFTIMGYCWQKEAIGAAASVKNR